MLEAFIIILLLLWILGLVTNATAGGLIHLLLIIALIGFFFRMVNDRKIIR